MSTQDEIRAEELQRRLRDTPDDSHARVELAKLAVRLGDYASALDHDARAWDLRPNEPAPIQHMIAVLVESGKWLGAMAAIDLVRQGACAETGFALDLAATQVIRKLVGVFPPRAAHRDADNVVDRLVAGASGRCIGVQIAVVRALIDLGRILEASLLLERSSNAESTAEERAQLCSIGGVLRERGGDLAGAIALYEQALVLDARQADAAINLISALLELGVPDTFTRIATLLMNLDPAVRRTPAVRFNEAIYLRHIGELEQAKALLESLAEDRSTELGRIARQVLISC